MKILLLGGEGFIGRNSYDLLSKSFRCYSLGRSPSPFGARRFIQMDPYANPIEELFDAYIHLIDNKSDPNREFFLLRHINPNAHVILFSSAVIYANPSSEYAKRKLFLEQIYLKNFKKLTILRLFNAYGKYQIPYRQGSLVANIFYNHINEIPIQINDMNAERDFIFAGDVAEYLRFVILNSLYGVYDLASGKMRSLKELCDLVQEVISSPLNILELKKSDVSCPSAGKIIPCNTSDNNIKPKLKAVFDFFKENNGLIKKLIQ
jgi:nucleoside-diphosphate-sugar epimerase